MNEETCWRLPLRSFRAASRARERSRIASCRSSGTQTAVSSPARDSLARPYRIASVRLHPIARFLRDQRGRRHDAVVAKLPDQPIEPVSRRPRLVAKCQLTVFGRKFGDELARRRFRGVDLAEIANVPATTILRDRNRIAQL